MTALIATLSQARAGLSRPVRPSLPDLSGPAGRALALVTLAAVALSVPGGPTLVLDALSEAYLAVTVFVAGTLLLLGLAERGLGMDFGTLLRRHARWQVPIGALLGAFPGCGGAIIALTQFTRGHLSVGGVVATLTATMGDAMFLLLAQAPDVALLVLGVSMVVGLLTGWTVDAIHGQGFLRPSPRKDGGVACRSSSATSNREEPATARGLDRAWLLLLGPGLALGIAMAFQVDADAWLAPMLDGFHPVFWLGVTGAAGSLAIWVLRGRDMETGEGVEGQGGSGLDLKPVVATTSFVTAWVVFAFAGYELAMAGLGLDIGRLFEAAAPAIPAIAVLIGLIPGCGPQIVVTTLYLSGVAPLSAQLGNAIANDGDALFPAIAVAPRAAVVATLYSGFPAIVVAYGAHILIG